MFKIYEEKYNSESPKIKDDTLITIASDLHYHTNMWKEPYLNLIDWCIENNPKYIVLPGDLYETIDFVNDKPSREFFERFLKSLSELTTVIISLGNHEIGNFSIKSRLTKVNTANTSYLKGLQNPNLYVLDNETLTKDDITFIGYTPTLESYKSLTNQRVLDNFIEDYNKRRLNPSPNKLNILLCHNPYQICNPSIINSLDNHELLDVAISGHLHDGYMPKVFDKYINGTDIGIFNDPFVSPKPGIPCRGKRKVSNIELIISQGFRKHTHPIFKLIDPINAHDIETLTIRKK